MPPDAAAAPASALGASSSSRWIAVRMSGLSPSILVVLFWMAVGCGLDGVDLFELGQSVDESGPDLVAVGARPPPMKRTKQ